MKESFDFKFTRKELINLINGHYGKNNATIFNQMSVEDKIGLLMEDMRASKNAYLLHQLERKHITPELLELALKVDSSFVISNYIDLLPEELILKQLEKKPQTVRYLKKVTDKYKTFATDKMYTQPISCIYDIEDLIKREKINPPTVAQQFQILENINVKRTSVYAFRKLKFDKQVIKKLQELKVVRDIIL